VVRDGCGPREVARATAKEPAGSMSWWILLAVAVALAADAFAVAIAAGLVLSPLTGRRVFRLAFHFGLFQALMPTIGWTVGRSVHAYIAAVNHWLAFGLLGVIGVRMLRDSLRPSGEARPFRDPTTGWQLVLLSVATSIDALAVGLSLAVIGSPIIFPALLFGAVAAAFTAAGMALGRRLASAWGRRVEFAGGLILIGIGVKILIEHILA